MAERTYILDSGDYYITAAADAHQAVNNVLTVKGYAENAAMAGQGDASQVAVWTLSQKRICAASASGAEVTNLFDDAALEDALYLSRSNWAVLDSWDRTAYVGGIAYATGTLTKQSLNTNTAGTVSVHEASEKVLNGLLLQGWEASGNPYAMDGSDGHYTSIETGKTAEKALIDMQGLPYEDSAWEALLSQMSLTEMHNLYAKAGWGTIAVNSISKPRTLEFDGPQGLIDFFAGNDGYRFPAQNVLGATWNKALSRRMGELVGHECVLRGITGWWSPGINIHRTPFSGRNFEYFSEDGIFTGLMGEKQILGAQSMGVNCFPKHMFMNDQETNRQANGSVATFAQEQAIRELYAVPVEHCVVRGGAKGVMSSMNRLGTSFVRGSYAVNERLLRGEWGFVGAIVTDYNLLTPEQSLERLAGGCDMQLTTGANLLPEGALSQPGVQSELLRASHNICYIQADSLTMNGYVPGARYHAGTPVYAIYLAALEVFIGLLLLYGTFEVVFCGAFRERFHISRRVKWAVRIPVLVLVLGVLAFAGYMYVTQWRAALELAFSIQ